MPRVSKSNVDQRKTLSAGATHGGRFRWSQVLVLAAVGLAVYGGALSNEFVMDDEEQVVLNEPVHQLSNIPSFFASSTWNAAGGNRMHGIYYKPLMMTAYDLLWNLGGGTAESAFYFHAFQLGIHIANAALLLRLLGFFFELPIALTFALIFLVHPFNSEAVLYVAALQDALFAFFGLIALNLAISSARGRLSAGRLGGISALLLASLLSKETGALFLALIPAWIFIFHRRHFGKVLAASAIVGGFYVVFRFGLAGLALTAKNEYVSLAKMDLATRMMTLPKILVFYFKTFVFPSSLAMMQDWVVREATLADFWLPLLIVGATFFGWYRLSIRAKNPTALFFSVWTLLGLALHAQIVPLDGTVADRWFYFTMMGVLGVLAEIVTRRVPWRRLAVPAGAATALALVLLSARAWSRSQDWKDGFTLYSTDVVENPTSFILQNNVGVELFRRGERARAREHFEQSTRLFPTWMTAWSNLGAAYEAEGNLQKAEECYAESLKHGDYYLAYQNYAGILARTGRREEAKKFLEDRALPRFPKNAALLSLYERVR